MDGWGGARAMSAKMTTSSLLPVLQWLKERRVGLWGRALGILPGVDWLQDSDMEQHWLLLLPLMLGVGMPICIFLHSEDILKQFKVRTGGTKINHVLRCILFFVPLCVLVCMYCMYVLHVCMYVCEWVCMNNLQDIQENKNKQIFWCPNIFFLVPFMGTTMIYLFSFLMQPLKNKEESNDCYQSIDLNRRFSTEYPLAVL